MSLWGWGLALCPTRVGSLQHHGVGAVGVQAGLVLMWMWARGVLGWQNLLYECGHGGSGLAAFTCCVPAALGALHLPGASLGSVQVNQVLGL